MYKFILLFVIVMSVSAFAQKNEVSILGGGQIALIPNAPNTTGFALEGTYSRRLVAVPMASLHFELPILGTFSASRDLPVLGSADYSALFVTPGLKLKLGSGPVKPYFTAGVGWAHFRQDASAFTPEFTTTTNVVQFGGGTEFAFGPAALLLEVRDYYSGPIKFDLATVSDRQHNVAAMAGIGFRW